MWKSVLKELPHDGETVWIRVINIYGEPCLADFLEHDLSFKVVETGIIIPAYMVSRWKQQ